MLSIYINVLMCTKKTHKLIISFSIEYLLLFPFTTLFYSHIKFKFYFMNSFYNLL